jgi:hypothetical protein
MSAVVSSAAQAIPNTNFTTTEFPSVLYGTQEGEPTKGLNYIETTSGRRTECHIAEYEATMDAAAQSITVTPHLAQCSSSGVSTTTDLNGCHFKFYAGTKVSTTEVAGGKADIVCPVGKSITVTVGPGICETHIPPQTGLTNTETGKSGITYTNEGSESSASITIDINVNNLTYTETDTPSSFLCPFTSHTTHGTNGRWASSVLLAGYRHLGTELTGAGSTTPGTTIYKRGSGIGGHVK